MTNSIFSKAGNGNISYRRYFNGWRNGTLKNRLTIKRGGQSIVFHMLDGGNLPISVDQGNNVFDQSDYHQGLCGIDLIESAMGFGGQHYSYYLQQAKQYDQSLGGPNRYDNDPTIDSYDNGPVYSAIRGQFIEFLDARDGMLDGEITDATMKEFRSKANAGTSYTQADFSEVKKLIDTEKAPPQTGGQQTSKKTTQSTKKQSSSGFRFDFGKLALFAGVFFAIRHFTQKKEAAQPTPYYPGLIISPGIRQSSSSQSVSFA